MARAGVPPNANAETRTPVSTTTRGLARSARAESPSHAPHRIVDVLGGELRTAEGRLGHTQRGIEARLRGERGEHVLLGVDPRRAPHRSRVAAREAPGKRLFSVA